MKYPVFLLVLLLIFAGAGCSPVIRTTSESAEDFKLSNYGTFGFYEVDASRAGLGLGYRSEIDYIQQEITRQLEQRGLRRTSNDPDLLVNIGIVVRDTTQTRETNILTDPPFYVGQRRYHWETKEVVVRRYQEGTITVDLVADAKNELVWQGTAESVMEEKTEKVQEQIREGMQKLFKELDKKQREIK